MHTIALSYGDATLARLAVQAIIAELRQDIFEAGNDIVRDALSDHLDKWQQVEARLAEQLEAT